MAIRSFLFLLSVTSGLAACVPDPVAGLYVDLSSTATSDWGCSDTPYALLNEAVSALPISGGQVLLVAPAATATYGLGGVTIAGPVTIVGNLQTVQVQGTIVIAAGASLSLMSATFSFSPSLTSSPLSVTGTLSFTQVTVSGSHLAWGNIFEGGALTFKTCTVQNTMKTLLTSSIFGVKLTIQDSHFANNYGDQASILLLRPVVKSASDTIFQISNSDFKVGSAPTVAVLVDTSLFGDTYLGSSNNAVQVTGCSWSDYNTTALTLSTWFISVTMDNCHFDRNNVAVLTSGQTTLMTVTNSQFNSNTGRALSFSLLGNPTVTVLRPLLSIQGCVFRGNGRALSIDAGELFAQAVIVNTEFRDNGLAAADAGCMYSASVALSLTFVIFTGCKGKTAPSMFVDTTSNFELTDVTIKDSSGTDATGIYVNNGAGKMLRVLFQNLRSEANIIYTLSGVSTNYTDVVIDHCISAKQIMNGYLNIWFVKRLIMQHSRAEDMLLYYTGTTETLNLYDSIFLNSSASSVHLHPGGTTVYFYNCTFNFTSPSETVILINTGELTALIDCTLSGSFRTIFSGLLAEYQFNMQRCKVTDALIDGLFDGNYFTAYVTNTEFRNVTVRQASLVFLFKVTFNMVNVVFTNLKGNILNLSKSQVTMKNVSITNYTTYQDYQFIEASETNFTVTNFSVTNFQGYVENSLFSLSESSVLNLTNCSFVNLFQTEPVGLNSISETNLTLINVIFDNWNVTLFDAELSGFWLVNSSFTRGGSGSPKSEVVKYDGGLINGLHVANVWMENCVFEDLGALNGGILYLYYEIPTKPTLQHVNRFDTFVVSLNTTFTNTSAVESGGVFYISEGSATLFNSSFVNSRAGRNGGFFNFLCNPHITDYLCKYNLTDISLNHSSAGIDGGAIKYDRMEPIMIDVLRINNTAMYGPFIAGYPITAEFVNAASAVPLRLGAINVTEASGQEISHLVYLGLYDHRKVLVSTEQTSMMTISSHSSAVLLSGLVNVKPKDGVYKVEHITVISPPGTVKQLYFASAAIDYVNSDPNTGVLAQETQLVYILRNCTTGEILKGDQCYQCEKGSYSFTTTDTLCQKCKQGMICNGGANVTIEAGYWRPDNTSDDVFACTLADKCLGGAGTECIDGYEGRLCTVCSSKWFRYGRALCSKCGSMAVSVTQGSVILLLVVCFLAFIIYSSLSAVGKKKKSDISVQLRILINFVQVMMLMNNFQIVWPSVLTRYFDGLYVSGNSSQMAFSAECYSDEGEMKYMYQKLILMTVMPVTITLLSCLSWGIVGVFKRNFMYLTQHNICTMCVLLLTVHPIILQSAGQLLTCKDMEKGTSWLVADMTIQCWEGKHLMFTTSMAIPVLIFWCIGIPLGFYIALVTSRKRLKEESVARRFAFIYSGYQPESYYWEFVVVVRKSYFVLVSNLLSTYNMDVQSYTGLLGLAFFLLIHNIKKPFAGIKLNQLEAYSLIASIVTLICGMLYDTALGRNDATYYIMVAVVLLANLNFLLRCLFGVLRRIREVIVAKYPKSRNCLYFNRKNAYSVTQQAEMGESRFSYPEVKD